MIAMQLLINLIKLKDMSNLTVHIA